MPDAVIYPRQYSSSGSNFPPLGIPGLAGRSRAAVGGSSIFSTQVIEGMPGVLRILLVAVLVHTIRIQG